MQRNQYRSTFNEGNDFSEFILLGDVNTNVLVTSSNNILVNALRKFERIFGFKQLITEPTIIILNLLLILC